MSDFEDDEWIEIEKARGGAVATLPDAQVRVTQREGRKAVVWIALRRAHARWAEAGLRFRVQIGGLDANRIRLVPDMHGGKFEAVMFKGTARICVGFVNLWPNETREPVSCVAALDPAGALILTLPADFARPRVKALPPPSPPSAPSPRPTTGETKPSREEMLAENAADEERTRNPVPACLGGAKFTPVEREIVRLLMERVRVSRQAVMLASAPDPAADDMRDDKIVDVYMTKLRPRLASLGLEIRGERTVGWYLAIEHRRDLRKLVEIANG